MPIYEYQCSSGHKFDRFKKIANLDDDEFCPECQKLSVRLISAPMVIDDLPGYASPVDGRWIEGRKAREEDLKRHNCRPWEGLEVERQMVKAQEDEMNRAIDKIADRAVEETLAKMPAESKNLLLETQ